MTDVETLSQAGPHGGRRHTMLNLLQLIDNIANAPLRTAADMRDCADSIRTYTAELRRLIETENRDEVVDHPERILEAIRDRVKELNDVDDDPIVELLIETSFYDNGYFYNLSTVCGLTANNVLYWVELNMDDDESDLGDAIADGRLMDDSALHITFDWKNNTVAHDESPSFKTLSRFSGAPVGTIEDGNDAAD